MGDLWLRRSLSNCYLYFIFFPSRPSYRYSQLSQEDEEDMEGSETFKYNPRPKGLRTYRDYDTDDDVSNIFLWKLCDNELKQRRRHRQRERQKSNRLNNQNNNSVLALQFSVHFFAATARVGHEISRWKVLWRRETHTTTNFSFSF